MNINGLWAVLVGRGSPFDRILKTLRDLECEVNQINTGRTPWQQNVTARLAAIESQLDRIEEAVTGSDAAYLIVEVGTPTEQI